MPTLAMKFIRAHRWYIGLCSHDVCCLCVVREGFGVSPFSSGRVHFWTTAFQISNLHGLDILRARYLTMALANGVPYGLISFCH